LLNEYSYNSELGRREKEREKKIQNLGFSASTMRLACERDAKFTG